MTRRTAAVSPRRFERPELVHAHHPAIDRRGVVERQDPVHLGDEVRVVRSLPGGGGLPGDPAFAQYPAQGLAADGGDHVLLDQVLGELGQAPGGERGDLPVAGGRPGDQADVLTHLAADRPGASPAPFWVQGLEPPLVERVDDVAHLVGADLHQRGDVRHRLALRGHHHHDRPPQLHRILRGPADPLQPTTLLHPHRPDWRRRGVRTPAPARPCRIARGRRPRRRRKPRRRRPAGAASRGDQAELEGASETSETGNGCRSGKARLVTGAVTISRPTGHEPAAIHWSPHW